MIVEELPKSLSNCENETRCWILIQVLQKYFAAKKVDELWFRNYSLRKNEEFGATCSSSWISN